MTEQNYDLFPPFSRRPIGLADIGREIMANSLKTGGGIVETLNKDYFGFLLDRTSGEQSLSLKCMPPLGHHIVEKIKPEITLHGREVALKAIWHCSLHIGIKKVAEWPEIKDYAKLRDEFRTLGDLGTDEDKDLGEFLREFGFKRLGGFKQLTFFYGEESRKALTTVVETLSEDRMKVATIACFAAWADEDCLAEKTRRECKEYVDRFRSRVRLLHRMGRSGVDYLLEVREERARRFMKSNARSLRYQEGDIMKSG